MAVINQHERTRQSEEATEWFLLLQDADLTDEELDRWRTWMAEPLNERAFEEIEAIWAQFDRVETPELPGPAETLGDNYDGSVPVLEWLANQRRRRHTRRMKLAAAAAIVLAAGLVVILGGSEDEQLFSQRFQTGIAEHREVTLPDGTRLSIGARSRIDVSYSGHDRQLVLEEGAALFQVFRDPDRPFVVRAGAGTITALGTAFNVARTPERVVVTVTDGNIRVENTSNAAGVQVEGLAGEISTETTVLNAGQQVTLYQLGRMGPVEPVDARAAIAWRDGRLHYRSEELRHVIADVNRYARFEIILADPSLGDLAFTGTVFHHQIESWLDSLEFIFPVTVEVVGDGNVRRVTQN